MKIKFETYIEMMMWKWTAGEVMFPWLLWEEITRADNLRGDNPRYFLVATVIEDDAAKPASPPVVISRGVETKIERDFPSGQKIKAVYYDSWSI